MSLASHLAELKRRHGEVDDQIEAARTSPSTDGLEVAALKRRKLALKDEMEKLRSTPTTH